ncbi:MAG TPA: HlyD family efflux transporter periplasmic adaptor subunit [Chitinophagales bacterium]|jgi:adhesin transport system membrane fusion protein|nr:HlyD family efflux transporter periplasmic adaptor subunit [Chitinophagales bacterium]HPH87711.1 HlyD family efflux transporter periplasmic adaptor subunit [Chitinophagales bacterium]
MWLFDKDIEKELAAKNLSSYKHSIDDSKDRKRIIRISIILIILIGFIFLPWTQNIQTTGTVTTLRPEQRPQELNTLIAGKIDKWYVKEGDIVKKGDTILKISEIKNEYLDPKLVERTREQINAKASANNFYEGKVGALDNQIGALAQSKTLKIEQTKNKIQQIRLYIQSDSMAFIAADNEYKIANDQYKRQIELHKEGLRSLTELEQRNQVFQNAVAKRNIAENKYYNAKQELLNAQIELSAIEREYDEKIAKSESDKFQSFSQISGGLAEIAKLENQYNNYVIRNGFYYILAPQDGQITKTIKAGVGEAVKDGELMVRISPENFQFAVELYITPNDLPLIHEKQEVRLQFDGWPAIFFTGWPDVSYGTFSGKVVAIDNFISENGKFRILVKEKPGATEWPAVLKLGGGVKGIALLKNVPIWYELWRQLNGFPPDFYVKKLPTKEELKKQKESSDKE